MRGKTKDRGLRARRSQEGKVMRASSRRIKVVLRCGLILVFIYRSIYLISQAIVRCLSTDYFMLFIDYTFVTSEGIKSTLRYALYIHNTAQQINVRLIGTKHLVTRRRKKII